MTCTLSFGHHHHRLAFSGEVLGVYVLLRLEVLHHLHLGRRLADLLVVLQNDEPAAETSTYKRVQRSESHMDTHSRRAQQNA